jgi:hypothetical protein
VYATYPQLYRLLHNAADGKTIQAVIDCLSPHELSRDLVRANSVYESLFPIRNPHAPIHITWFIGRHSAFGICVVQFPQ